MPKEDTQFKPGQSGNPGGRPKGPSPLNELRKLMDENASPEKLAEFAMATLEDGIKKDGPSRKLIWQYLEGMPKQNVSIDATTRTVLVDDVPEE